MENVVIVYVLLTASQVLAGAQLWVLAVVVIVSKDYLVPKCLWIPYFCLRKAVHEEVLLSFSYFTARWPRHLCRRLDYLMNRKSLSWTFLAVSLTCQEEGLGSTFTEWRDETAESPEFQHTTSYSESSPSSPSHSSPRLSHAMLLHTSVDLQLARRQ